MLVFRISALLYKFARTIGLPHHFGMLMRCTMRGARQMSPKLSWGKMYREHAKFGLGAQSINLTSLNIYTDTGRKR
jgi:hypothetical protein